MRDCLMHVNCCLRNRRLPPNNTNPKNVSTHSAPLHHTLSATLLKNVLRLYKHSCKLNIWFLEHPNLPPTLGWSTLNHFLVWPTYATCSKVCLPGHPLSWNNSTWGTLGRQWFFENSGKIQGLVRSHLFTWLHQFCLYLQTLTFSNWFLNH